jgi:deoxycytidine triphosphate deaminase
LFNTESLSACSYDLRIGTIFVAEKIVKRSSPDNEQIILQPGDIVSVLTLEELKMPDHIAATAFAINSLSSDGLLVLNPGHVDPGFCGPLSVRLINIRATPKAISIGMPIFTVIFEYLAAPTSQPYAANISREKRELDFKARDVEQNPGSLFKLISQGKNRPLMTAQEVRSIITEHWITRAIFLFTVLGVLVGIYAAVVGTIALLRATQPTLPVVSANPVATPTPYASRVTPSPIATTPTPTPNHVPAAASTSSP